MTPSPFAAFAAAVRAAGPKTAVVLGSGLGGVVAGYPELAAVPFGDIPGLVPPTVHGHKGRLALLDWDGTPALVFFGRLHFYEGHPWDVVTGTVRAVADLGVKTLLLTNAAGGIHPSLGPGSLMAIRAHLTWIGPSAWREQITASPYSDRLLQLLQAHEAAEGRDLLAGVYAALTGPCYETPAEIRALAASGADAVGMSTAKEADAAAGLGLEVAAVSCVTNKAAGLAAGVLDHREVLEAAPLATPRLAGLVRRVVRGG